MASPCGGCPPHCKVCIFAEKPQELQSRQLVRSSQEYGCVRPDGGDIVLNNGTLGMMRGTSFHPVTAQGAAFLHETGNALARHC